MPDDNVTKFLMLMRVRKTRNYIILAVLVFILLLIMAYRLLWSNKHKLPGALRAVKCLNCDFKQAVRAKDITKIKCKHCGSQCGLVYKCQNCDLEYSIRPILHRSSASRKVILDRQKRERQCPNCGSKNTKPLPANEL
jgi:ribosomal protein S27E